MNTNERNQDTAGQRGDIGARLKQARELAGLSQGQVAKLMSLHRPTISEMEAGRRRVSAEELKRLADLYAVRVGWLAGEAEEDSLDPRHELVAREIAKLKSGDVDRLLALLKILKTKEGDD